MVATHACVRERCERCVTNNANGNAFAFTLHTNRRAGSTCKSSRVATQVRRPSEIMSLSAVIRKTFCVATKADACSTFDKRLTARRERAERTSPRPPARLIRSAPTPLPARRADVPPPAAGARPERGPAAGAARAAASPLAPAAAPAAAAAAAATAAPAATAAASVPAHGPPISTPAPVPTFASVPTTPAPAPAAPPVAVPPARSCRGRGRCGSVQLLKAATLCRFEPVVVLSRLLLPGLGVLQLLPLDFLEEAALQLALGGLRVRPRAHRWRWRSLGSPPPRQRRRHSD